MTHPLFRSAAPPSPSIEFRPRVFRYRHLIGGLPAWYALDRNGRMVPPGLRVVQPDERESAIVVELLAALANVERQRFKVIRARPSASAAAMSPGAFVRLLTRPRPESLAPPRLR